MNRFEEQNEVVLDKKTGLTWTKNASLSDFPMTWDEALAIIKDLNRSGLYGYNDWKLPNRKELLSIRWIGRQLFDRVLQMNREQQYGHNDWRVPNILELESLTDMGQHSPALPIDHLFMGVQDFYWSSTSSMYDTNYAWVIYMVDGVVGVGHKPSSEFYLRPVRGTK